jgi:uncharacterized protein YndB with AHSA1/START domain
MMEAVTDRTANDLAPSSKVMLEIVRIFDAPRPLVFEMWVKAQHMSHWAAPDGFTIPVNEGELRLGGTWRSCMRAPDGSEQWLSGTYREIAPPQRLVFSHQWDGAPETLVSVSFEEVGDKTRMTFRQTGFESVASRDGHDGGWNQSFGKLQSYLGKFIADDRARAAANDDGKVLELEHLFDAPRALVFKLWSSPEHIVRWWGPKGLYLSHCEMDFRVGGEWRFCMQPQQHPGHWIHGVYGEIRTPERLSFTYINDNDGHQMLVTLNFLERDGKTLLKFRQSQFFTVAERDAHGEGWSETFDIFESYLRLFQANALSETRLGWRQGDGVEADLKAAIIRGRAEYPFGDAFGTRPDEQHNVAG